jgi:hypothetical protein
MEENIFMLNNSFKKVEKESLRCKIYNNTYIIVFDTVLDAIGAFFINS